MSKRDLSGYVIYSSNAWRAKSPFLTIKNGEFYNSKCEIWMSFCKLAMNKLALSPK